MPALGDVKGCSQAEVLILSAVAWLCTGAEDYSSHLVVFLCQVLFKIENLVPFLLLSKFCFVFTTVFAGEVGTKKGLRV